MTKIEPSLVLMDQENIKKYPTFPWDWHNLVRSSRFDIAFFAHHVIKQQYTMTSNINNVFDATIVMFMKGIYRLIQNPIKGFTITIDRQFLSLNKDFDLDLIIKDLQKPFPSLIGNGMVSDYVIPL